MSEFGKEYAKLRLKLDNVDSLMTHDALLAHFKDWQPPKQVDEGQLYYVDFGFSSGGSYLNKDRVTYVDDPSEIGMTKTKFTEQEIKDIDERYWAFAVKVDEVDVDTFEVVE